MKTIYLSGPMTILAEECYNFKRFFYWQVIWEARGWRVINPAEIDCRKMLGGWVYREEDYDAIIEEDLRLIREEADAIFMMSGWMHSGGALMEYNEAVNKRVDFYFEDRDERRGVKAESIRIGA